MNCDLVPKANETSYLDVYKNTDAYSMAGKKNDLFSGLDQTVKVKIRKNNLKKNICFKSLVFFHRTSISTIFQQKILHKLPFTNAIEAEKKI